MHPVRGGDVGGFDAADDRDAGCLLMGEGDHRLIVRGGQQTLEEHLAVVTNGPTVVADVAQAGTAGRKHCLQREQRASAGCDEDDAGLVQPIHVAVEIGRQFAGFGEQRVVHIGRDQADVFHGRRSRGFVCFKAIGSMPVGAREIQFRGLGRFLHMRDA